MPGTVFVRQTVRSIVVLIMAMLLTGPAALQALAQGTSAARMIEDSPDHYAFSPSAMTVPVGTTVTWTNKSDAPHTVTSDTGAFGSATVAPSAAFRFTFSKAGAFSYHCSIHPYMHGTVTVTAAGASGQTAAAATAAPTPATLPATGAGGVAQQTAGAPLAMLLGILILGLSGVLMAARRW